MLAIRIAPPQQKKVNEVKHLSFQASLTHKRPLEAVEELTELLRKHNIHSDEWHGPMMRLVETIGSARGMAEALDARFQK